MLPRYSSLAPLERECYEEEVQPYRKTDYKQMMILMADKHNISKGKMQALTRLHSMQNHTKRQHKESKHL